MTEKKEDIIVCSISATQSSRLASLTAAQIIWHNNKCSLCCRHCPLLSCHRHSAHNVKKDHQNTLGEIASISFKFHFQTDYQQTLLNHTQGCHGCQKIRNLLGNSKIARSTINPSLSKIKKKLLSKNNKKWEKKEFLTWKLNFFAILLWILMHFLMFFLFYSFLAGWSIWVWVF